MTPQLTTRQVCEQFRIKAAAPAEIPRANRADFARWLGEWGLDAGVEVGTFEGAYAETLLAANPRLHLTCVDPWAVYAGYTDYMRQTTLARAYDTACARLAPHYGRCTIRRSFSVEAASYYKNGSLDFVYIDGNHKLLNVVADIAIWETKVKVGGIVAGHDFVKRSRWPHVQVVEAVTAWTSANNIDSWFLVGRLREPKRWLELSRTWFWVKER